MYHLFSLFGYKLSRLRSSFRLRIGFTIYQLLHRQPSMYKDRYHYVTI